ncbi:MAG: hypothetical protein IT425_03250 [Pirellulales bacterium]|nr:hypothetical protein [Pirellulales bacterium]
MSISQLLTITKSLGLASPWAVGGWFLRLVGVVGFWLRTLCRGVWRSGRLQVGSSRVLPMSAESWDGFQGALGGWLGALGLRDGPAFPARTDRYAPSQVGLQMEFPSVHCLAPVYGGQVARGPLRANGDS